MEGYLKLFEIRICEVMGFFKGLIITLLSAFSIMCIAIIYMNPEGAKKAISKLLYLEKGDDNE